MKNSYNNKQRKNNVNMKRQHNHKQRRNHARNRTNGSAHGGGGVFVTPIKNRPIITRTIRYLFDDQSTRVTVTSTELLRCFVLATSASTTAYPLVQCYRLLRVGCTMLPNNSSGTATFGFQWSGTNAPNQREILYAAQGIPSKASFYPPEDSSASWWLNTSMTANDIFAVDAQAVTTECPVYLDLDFQYVMYDGSTGTVTLSSSSSFTGVMTRAIGGGFIVPVDLSTGF